ncbi:MAG TPA: hypothetical protein VKW08_07995 [Xanthobacteraceae bacterium]|jgi:hypothetical protein|nr:hypothetical protein [Xanthobacteraceae bacterium]
MKQPRAMSLLETSLSTAAGFGISLLAQATVLPMLGVAVSFSQNVAFAVVMTFVSIARQFILRRVFEALHIRVPMSAAALAVLAERRRQIDAEGWTAEHDDAHAPGDLARAGAAYAIYGNGVRAKTAELVWPWAPDWWKPHNIRRDLVRGAALILAEIERFDRARNKRSAP